MRVDSSVGSGRGGRTAQTGVNDQVLPWQSAEFSVPPSCCSSL